MHSFLRLVTTDPVREEAAAALSQKPAPVDQAKETATPPRGKREGRGSTFNSSGAPRSNPAYGLPEAT